MPVLTGVYNTMTHTHEDVEVSQKVFDSYRRIGWNIDDNNKRFYKYKIQMSGLIGGEDGVYENFREFISEENDPQNVIGSYEHFAELRQFIQGLPSKELVALRLHCVDKLSDAEIGAELGITKQTANHRLRQTRRKIKEFIKKL